MTFRDVVILVPCHSLEDFPTELGESQAAGLLNAFAVAWHPALLAMVGGIPAWHRADDPPQERFSNRLIIVPAASEDRVPGGWIDRARSEGATVVAGIESRDSLLRAALAPMLRQDDDQPSLTEDVNVNAEMDINADIARDFHALGTCWLMLELLARHMHHYSSYDESFFTKTVLAAAEAALNNESEVAKERLTACFDLLAEARERFYPVDCYLLDLCLVTPDTAGAALQTNLRGNRPVNRLLKATDAETICRDQEETGRLIREAWSRGTADIAGGDWHEQPVPLVPLATALRDLQRGRQTFFHLFRQEPTTWGRRRFGHSVMQPQLLQKSGFHAALHFLLDDGIYPDREASRLRWEGCDNAGLDSISRIPLAAESASSWLRFPQRLAEAMEADQVAAAIFARWPEVSSPQFEDMCRITSYAPVLGRFVTFREYFMHTDTPGGMWHSDTREYLSPFLVQAVARREKNAISRFQQHSQRMTCFDAAAWIDAMASVLMGQPVPDERLVEVQDQLDAAGPDVFSLPDGAASGAPAVIRQADEALAALTAQARERLTRIVMHGAGPEPGWLCFNPLSFTRRIMVALPADSPVPAVGGPIKAVHADGPVVQALVELPPAGFAWFPAGTGTTPDPVTLAGPGHLQNEFFEVFISDETGGLAQLKKHGRSPNRLSQQLAFRFPRELTVKQQVGDEVREFKTWYSEMRGLTSEVTSTGPGLGEIVTTGELLDPVTRQKIAGFRQTFRVWRGRPLLEIETELEPQKSPSGDPWSSYYGARFAWNAVDASLTQSVLGAAQPVQGQRIESPDYLEIANSEERLTLLPLGLPFHRRTGPRMLDTLMLVDGESARRFRMVIAFDQHYPMQTALDVASEIIPVRTESGPPRAGQTGWFYHLDTRCVQVLRVTGLLDEPADPEEAGQESSEPTASPTEAGFALRLQETEGRYQSFYVELFRTPVSCRLRDFRGRTLNLLEPVRDGVRVDLSPFALVDLEVRFQ